MNTDQEIQERFDAFIHRVSMLGLSKLESLEELYFYTSNLPTPAEVADLEQRMTDDPELLAWAKAERARNTSPEANARLAAAQARLREKLKSVVILPMPVLRVVPKPESAVELWRQNLARSFKDAPKLKLGLSIACDTKAPPHRSIDGDFTMQSHVATDGTLTITVACIGTEAQGAKVRLFSSNGSLAEQIRAFQLLGERCFVEFVVSAKDRKGSQDETIQLVLLHDQDA